MLRRLLITTILAGFGLSGLALADNIAQISSVAQGNVYNLLNPDSPSGTLSFTGADQVDFAFDPTLGITVPGEQTSGETLATLTFTATTTTHASSVLLYGTVYEDIQGGFTGSFLVTDNTGGGTLLSGNFGPNGVITGIDGGNGMTFQDSASGGSPELTFWSPYVNFSYYSGSLDLSLGFSNLAQPLAVVDSFLGGTGTVPKNSDTGTSNNSGTAVYTLSATPLPPVTAEPGTVLLSGAALLGIGLFLRKRKLQPYF